MCERPGFWRWLVQVSVGAVRGVPRELVGVVRAMPEMFRSIRKPRITVAIRNPFYEFFTGLMALIAFPMISVVASDLALGTRIVLALLSLPSFLLIMHGVYRAWGDC